MFDYRKARSDDAESIFNIINPYAETNIILKRSISDILQSIGNFIVAVDGTEVIGAVSYYDYGGGLREIRSLAVLPRYKRSGAGSGLTSAILKQLENDQSIKIFALTYTPEFFLANDFYVVDKNTLPDKIWKDCRNCKNRLNCTETAVVYNNPVS